ncbi:hypothetical protein [Bowmanella denitrificans]|uniref:hypothetical protein n=1 Tax=Bowmanella denitrificans TaxID=366582 RepID=UPI000C9A02D0|nr:hypothetical protein [Bowmanella denitrificans]
MPDDQPGRRYLAKLRFKKFLQDLWQPILHWLKNGTPVSIPASTHNQYAPGKFIKEQLLLPTLAF